MTHYYRRGKLEVYGDILRAIRDDASEHGNMKLTRVQGRANVPYDRLKNYIDTMAGSGLLTLQEKDDKYSIEITEKGLQFLDHIETAAKFLKTFRLG